MATRLAIVDGNYPAEEHGAARGARRRPRPDRRSSTRSCTVLPVDDFVPQALFRAHRSRAIPRRSIRSITRSSRSAPATRPAARSSALAGAGLLRPRQDGLRHRCDQRSRACTPISSSARASSIQRSAPDHDHLLRRSADRHAAAHGDDRRAGLRALCPAARCSTRRSRSAGSACRSSFFSGLSSDLFGEQLRASLAASKVGSRFAHISARPTTLAFVRLVDGHASYVFYDENTAGRMLVEDDLPDTRRRGRRHAVRRHQPHSRTLRLDLRGADDARARAAAS